MLLFWMGKRMRVMRLRHGTPKMMAASSISGAICSMLLTPEREANGRNLTEATMTSRPKVP